MVPPIRSLSSRPGGPPPGRGWVSSSCFFRSPGASVPAGDPMGGLDRNLIVGLHSRPHHSSAWRKQWRIRQLIFPSLTAPVGFHGRVIAHDRRPWDHTTAGHEEPPCPTRRLFFLITAKRTPLFSHHAPVEREAGALLHPDVQELAGELVDVTVENQDLVGPGAAGEALLVRL